MYPVICQIGPVSIYSYGVMMAVAVVVCSILLSKDAKALQISSETIFDFLFWVVIAGILGGRLFFIILNLGYYIANPLKIFMVHHGGLAWQGSLILGATMTFVYIKKHKLPLWKFLDIVVPYAALGHAIGRLGCFLNGCCYGKEVAWGIYFPVHMAHLHPTQLYASGALFLIFVILKFYQKRTKVAGEVFILYLLLVTIQRFVIEFFRADHMSTLYGLSIFQYISLVIFLLALYVKTRLKS